MKDYSLNDRAEHNDLNYWHKKVLVHTSLSGKRILDIGCGGGAFLDAARELGAEIFGIDPNPLNGILLEKHSIPHFIGYFDAKDEKVIEFQPDIITCFEVIEHLYSPHEILSGAHELLQKNAQGGKLILSTPNAFNLMRALKFLIQQQHHDSLMDPVTNPNAEHIRAYSFGMVIKLLHNHGFSVKSQDILSGSIGRRFFCKHIVIAGSTSGDN